MTNDAVTAVADAEAVVTRIERKLTAERSSIADIDRARRDHAYDAAILEDAAALNQLAMLAGTASATRQRISDIELALDDARGRLAAAKAAELAERRPRYRSTRGREHTPAGQEFMSLDWPHADYEACNDSASLVLKYYRANSAHPRLAASPWHEASGCVYLPELPAYEPRQRGWRDPRVPWSNGGAGLDALFANGQIAAKPISPPAPPRRPAGAQRRVT